MSNLQGAVIVSESREKTMEEVRAELSQTIIETPSMRLLLALQLIAQAYNEEARGTPAIKAVLMAVLALGLNADELTSLYMAGMKAMKPKE